MTPRAFRPLLSLSGWTWAGLLLLALILRTFVPSGYMPDPSARTITLSLCTAHDSGTSLVVALDAPGEHHDTTSLNCPLCVLAHHASGSPLSTQAILIPSSPPIAVAFPTTPRIHPVFRMRGAPLGPRAPPVLMI